MALAIAMGIKNGTFSEDDNVIEFSVIDVAAAIGWNSGVVKYQLKDLEWVKGIFIRDTCLFYFTVLIQ